MVMIVDILAMTINPASPLLSGTATHRVTAKFMVTWIPRTLLLTSMAKTTESPTCFLALISTLGSPDPALGLGPSPYNISYFRLRHSFRDQNSRSSRDKRWDEPGLSSHRSLSRDRSLVYPLRDQDSHSHSLLCLL